MNALLIQVDVSFFSLSGEGSFTPRLGLYYIAEYAARLGFEVKVKKYYSTEPITKNLVHILQDSSCNVLGFYVDSENIWVIRRLIFQLKEELPELFTIVGGPQITGDPRLALKRLPGVDVAIVGEGERPFSQLLEVGRKEIERINNIKGLAYIDNEGNYCFTGSQVPLNSLDDYPFPRREKYSLDSDIDFIDILTGRGCIGRCAFCFEGSKKENNLRLRSVESVIEEIDYVISNLRSFKYISFLDDTFILNPERTRRICHHFIEKYHGEIKWYCEARVDILIKNQDLLPLMKEAGLIRVQLGGESGSQHVLDAYNKHMKKEDLISVVKMIYDAGIPSIYINFIVGGAFETLESFNDTVELAKLLLETAPFCASVGCSLFTPYVGTPMRNNPSEFGISIIDVDSIKGPDGRLPCVETESLNQYKILQLKTIFEDEITKKQFELIKASSKNDVFNQFYYHYKWGMASEWYTLCKTIEPIKNYHEAILGYGFKSVTDIDKEDLRLCIPYRTIHPFSDGEAYFRETFHSDYKKNSEIENAVLLLSSGKLCYAEILYLIKKGNPFKGVENIEEIVYNTYLDFDKEYLIVWKEGW